RGRNPRVPESRVAQPPVASGPSISRYPMSHSLTALGLVVAASVLPITAQTQAPAQPPRRSLQLDDFYLVRSIVAPTISPDGRWVLYTVSTPVEETNGSSSEAWIVSTDGAKPPTAIRHQGRGVTAPGWTEDGRVRYT